MRNESDVKKEVKKILTRLGAYYYMPVPNGMGARGISDFLVCYKGRFVSIETKFGKNTESTWQKLQGNSISVAGGYYTVINENNVNMLETYLLAIGASQGE